MMPNETFHFPPYRLDPGVGLLFRDGAPVSVEPRAVKVLSYLVRNRERVVPKEELLDRVWVAQRGLSLGEDYRFYHTILRRVLYESLPPRRRRRLHLLAASAIEDVHARHPERVAEALGAHYEAAGDAARAFRRRARAAPHNSSTRCANSSPPTTRAAVRR